MNINKFINLFSIVCGFIIIFLGVLVAVGITKASPSNAGFLFFLGGMVLIWSLIQRKRRGY